MLGTYIASFSDGLGRVTSVYKSTRQIKRADCKLMVLLTINYLVALLGLVLGLSSYLVLKRYGVPDKICLGAAFLSIVVVAIFWTSVQLGAENDEDE